MRASVIVPALWLLLGACAASAAERPDVLVDDFEGQDYGDWKATGEAFGPGPARGTLPRQMPVEGFLGKGLVNTYYKGDGTTGTLTSPPLKIERKYIKFLIGGGGHAGKTCMNLLVDGKVVRTATGPNIRSGGSELLEWQAWDVAELAGQSAAIQIVDDATGGWGHINVDHIVQTDQPLPASTTRPQREITFTKRYLNLPVKNGAARRRASLEVEGQVVREFDIHLAEAEPDFWVFLDLAPFQGKKGTLRVDRLPEDSKALAAIEQDDAIRGAEDLYREPLRPQFHFSSRRGWNNDPNGLVFSQGEYHLYYQHNPYGWAWGNMHWGHAVGRDLVHWQELPIAIYPRQFGDWVYSGSAVADKDNTAGWRTGDAEVIVAAYTSTGRGECIAYSNDRGRTFTEYEGNPVVKHSGRDPRLLWYAPGKHWVMAVYDEAPGEADKDKKRGIAFYTSKDLKQWEFRGRVPGFFECPDLFELAVEGKPNERKWVLTAASSEYMLGTFDGKTFTPETPKLRGHRGQGFYAAQTYSDIPAADGRRIQIGWLRTATPGMPFNQCMSVPLELKLAATADGPRLTWTPVKELESLRAKSHRLDVRELKEGDANPLEKIQAELVELRAEFTPGDGETTFTVRGASITYDASKQELVVNKNRAAAPLIGGKLRLTIYCDRTALEVFASDGLCYVPVPFIPKADDLSLGLSVKGGAVKFTALEVHELKSALPAIAGG